MPNLTFASPANAVLYERGEPVLADVHPDTWGVNPDRIEGLIDERTKAIIVVHLYGNPCDMGSILRVARAHDLFVVEDCAEALGAEYRGKKVGTLGDISCFSFYGNKIITTGEGGMLLTSNSAWADRVRRLRDHGMRPERRYWHEEVGYNYRMTNLQAALGVAQLERVSTFLRKKREVAHWYSSFLKHPRILQVHPELEWGRSVFWLYSVICDFSDGDGNPMSRDAVARRMLARGVETRPFFYPLDEMPPYAHVKADTQLDVSHRLSRQGLSLPSSATLSREDIHEITDVLGESLEN